MRTEDFDYFLPQESIAQTPVYPRHASRLMVLNRQEDTIVHAYFYEIGRFLRPGDLLVLNETRVIKARINARKLPGGGRVELLLLKEIQEDVWECLVGGKGLIPGKRLLLPQGYSAEIVAMGVGANRTVKFSKPVKELVEIVGQVPLPPYIRTSLADEERYQTVYARPPGSSAAPTAGLHFTRELMAQLEAQGIRFAFLTLHVGLDTFAPVTESSPTEHVIHSEWCHLPIETADAVRQTRAMGGRVIAVGTTSVRTLEAAAQRASEGQVVEPYEGFTDLFILPGHVFRAVDAMITNFHLPRSTLIMLVSAFAGRERILAAYRLAIHEGYRFYSFGDAMLIL